MNNIFFYNGFAFFISLFPLLSHGSNCSTFIKVEIPGSAIQKMGDACNATHSYTQYPIITQSPYQPEYFDFPFNNILYPVNVTKIAQTDVSVSMNNLSSSTWGTDKFTLYGLPNGPITTVIPIDRALRIGSAGSLSLQNVLSTSPISMHVRAPASFAASADVYAIAHGVNGRPAEYHVNAGTYLDQNNNINYNPNDSKTISLPTGTPLDVSIGVGTSTRGIATGSAYASLLSGFVFATNTKDIYTNKYSTTCINLDASQTCSSPNNIYGPTDINAGALRIGNEQGDGTLSVETSTLSTSSLMIGSGSGSGSVSVSKKGKIVIAGNADLGTVNGSQANITISDGSLAVGGALNIEKTSGLNIVNNGSISVGQNFNFGDNASASKLGLYNSTLNVNGATNINSGALSLSSTNASPSTLATTHAVISGGTINASGGSAINISNTLIVEKANNGIAPTVGLNNAAINTNASSAIGDDGKITLTNGSVANFKGGLNISSNGLVTIDQTSSANIIGDTSIIGSNGKTASAIISGTLNTTNNLLVGSSAGAAILDLRSADSEQSKIRAGSIIIGTQGKIITDNADITAHSGMVVNGDLIVNAPGDNGTGVRIHNDLTLGHGSRTEMQISSKTNYGDLVSDGNIVINGSVTANFTNGFTPSPGDVFTLVTAKDINTGSKEVDLRRILVNNFPTFDPKSPIVAVTRMDSQSGLFDLRLSVEKFNGQYELPLDQQAKLDWQNGAGTVNAMRAGAQSVDQFMFDTLEAIKDKIKDKLNQMLGLSGDSNDPRSLGMSDVAKEAYKFLKDVYENGTGANPTNLLRTMTLTIIDNGLKAIQTLAQALANDPPDQNYSKLLIARSLDVSPNFSEKYGIIGGKADKIINDQQNYIQSLQYALISYERYQAAIIDNDTASALSQLSLYKQLIADSKTYADNLSNEISAFNEESNNGNNGIDSQYYTDLIQYLEEHGFSNEMRSSLSNIGLSEEEQQQLINDIIHIQYNTPSQYTYDQAFRDFSNAYNTLAAKTASDVPEPAILLTLLIGFIAMGYITHINRNHKK